MLCEHGNVLPCAECDIEPLEKEIKRLNRLMELEAQISSLYRHERDSLKAQVAELESKNMVPSGVWQFYQDGEWHTGGWAKDHKINTIDAGYKVRDLWVKQEQE
jgi:hypothetical protein